MDRWVFLAFVGLGGAALAKWRSAETDDGEGDGDVMDGEQQVEAYRAGEYVGTITVRSVDGVLMELGVARAWEQMRDAAAAEGVTLEPSSGFRTMARQTELFADYQRALALYNSGLGAQPTAVAAPGHSNHQSGTALDIHVASSNSSPEYAWLAGNASRWSFSNVGATFDPPEWWHWEWHGVQGGLFS